MNHVASQTMITAVVLVERNYLNVLAVYLHISAQQRVNNNHGNCISKYVDKGKGPLLRYNPIGGDGIHVEKSCWMMEGIDVRSVG